MVELTSAELKIGRPEILYPYLFFNVYKNAQKIRRPEFHVFKAQSDSRNQIK